MGNLKNSMGSRQIVLVSTAGFSVLNMGIFWREAKKMACFTVYLRIRVKNISMYSKYNFASDIYSKRGSVAQW
jgi:hypothetical protein